MQIYTNEPYVKRRARQGQYLTWASMAILLVGAGISFFAPQYVAIALICLPIGFVGSNIGSAYMRRFVRKPRPDEELARSLKGLDDRFEYYAWQLPVANVLLGPSGLYAFIVRDTDGQVNANDGTWKQPFSVGRMFTVFAREGLGNPTRDAAAEVSRLQGWIQQWREKPFGRQGRRFLAGPEESGEIRAESGHGMAGDAEAQRWGTHRPLTLNGGSRP